MRLLWVVFFLLTSLLARVAIAGPPYITDDPQILAPHQLQTILYGTLYTPSVVKTINAPAVEFDYGIFPRTELDGYFVVASNVDTKPVYGNSDAVGLGDSTIEIKYLLLHETSTLPAIALVPYMTLPTGSRARGLGYGLATYAFAMAFEKSFAAWDTYIETGYLDIPGQGNISHFYGGWVLEKTISPKLSLGAELYSEGNTTQTLESYTLLNLGCTYNFSPHSQLLVSLGHTFIGQSSWSAYLGLAWN